MSRRAESMLALIHAKAELERAKQNASYLYGSKKVPEGYHDDKQRAYDTAVVKYEAAHAPTTDEIDEDLVAHTDGDGKVLRVRKPDFTIEALEKACREFNAEHGTYPTQTNGDCSKYFDWPEGTETWSNVSQCIRQGFRGLESLRESSLVKMCRVWGLSKKKPDFTPESIEQACRAFHDEHGTCPNVKSGDCSKYFGWPEGTDTWKNVNSCIRQGGRGLESLRGSSIAKMCSVWGLKKPDFTPESVEQACRSYHTEHGTHPKQSSGDCSKHFGWPEGTENWKNVDASIRARGRGLESMRRSSLPKMCRAWGLKKPDFTPESVERACRVYHSEHGTHPGLKSGDCSRYFGWPKGTEKWLNVNQNVRNGGRGLGSMRGSSLAKMCRAWGLTQ